MKKKRINVRLTRRNPLGAGTYQWRVRAVDRDVWSTGADIVSENEVAAPEVLLSNADDAGDVFFAAVAGTWDWDFAIAQHVGSVNDWEGTNEVIFIAGKGRVQDLFIGSDDPNILCLTDGDN